MIPNLLTEIKLNKKALKIIPRPSHINRCRSFIIRAGILDSSTDCKSHYPVTGYRLPIADYRLPITGLSRSDGELILVKALLFVSDISS
jgi:hypothetical protein